MLIFAERIRQLIWANNLTHLKVVERIRATKGMINTCENSSRYPSIYTIVSLARFVLDIYRLLMRV